MENIKMICGVCGFIAIFPLPEDWTCPDCGAGEELLEKVEEGDEEIKKECKKCGFKYSSRDKEPQFDLKEIFKNLDPSEWVCPICDPGVLK